MKLLTQRTTCRFIHNDPFILAIAEQTNSAQALPIRYGVKVKKTAKVKDLKKNIATIALGSAALWSNVMLTKIDRGSKGEGANFIKDYLDQDSDDKQVSAAIKPHHTIHAFESHEFIEAADAVHFAVNIANSKNKFIFSPVFSSIYDTASCAQMRQSVVKQILFLLNEDKVASEETVCEIAKRLKIYCLDDSTKGMSSFEPPKGGDEKDDEVTKGGRVVLIPLSETIVFKKWAEDTHNKEIVDNICPLVVVLDDAFEEDEETPVENDKSAINYAEDFSKAKKKAAEKPTGAR